MDTGHPTEPVAERELLEAVADLAYRFVGARWGHEQGGFTTSEFSARVGGGRDRTYAILETLVDQGLLEHGKIWRKNRWGVMALRLGWTVTEKARGLIEKMGKEKGGDSEMTPLGGQDAVDH